jgi:hypothetical protein
MSPERFVKGESERTLKTNNLPQNNCCQLQALVMQWRAGRYICSGRQRWDGQKSQSHAVVQFFNSVLHVTPLTVSLLVDPLRTLF